ncbi:MAG: EamA family transporter [Treponema sp.]|nr:EamA family transporter [Treponema sp.]
MNSKITSFFASAGLLLTAAIWGFAFVVVKDSLLYIGSFYMVAIRFTIAAIGLALIFFKKLKFIDKKHLFMGAVTGFFLYAGYIVQTVGCFYTTAGKNAFLTTIYVIFIPLISWPLYKKRPALFVFVAAVMSLTGIGLLALVGNDFSGSEGSGFNRGDVLTIICGLFYALHILWTEKCNREGCDTMIMTLLQFVFAAIFGWLTAPFFDGAFPVEALKNSKVIISMLYLGIFSSMICFSLQNIGLKYVNSSLASLFLSFESVFGILFSALFLGEKLTLRMAIGCALIFFAVILAENGCKIFRRKSKI